MTSRVASNFATAELTSFKLLVRAFLSLYILGEVGNPVKTSTQARREPDFTSEQPRAFLSS
jgi:hypothetical protein